MKDPFLRQLSISPLPNMTKPVSLVAALLLFACVGLCQEKGESTKPGGAKEEKEEKLESKIQLKVREPAKLDEILRHRLTGGLGYKFTAFANMFFVKSAIDTGWSVGLSAGDQKIAETELQPVFPQFYRPTLRELLDTMSLQTSSSWSYRKED